MRHESSLFSQLKSSTRICLLHCGMGPVPGRHVAAAAQMKTLGHIALSAVARQHRIKMSDEVFRNNTALSVLALGSGKASALVFVQGLNKALHSSRGIIIVLSVPKFNQICD